MTDEKKPPQEVVAIKFCAGVDVMADRLVIAIYAFAPGDPAPERKSNTTLWGDPFQGDVWQSLMLLIGSPVHWHDGAFIGLTAVAIDAGGHHTQQIYHFVHQYPRSIDGVPLVLATKTRSVKGQGIGKASTMVDVRYQDHCERLELFFMDVNTNEDRDDVTLAGLARFALDRAALAV